MSFFQLLDKGFDIGCDYLFRGLRLLPLLFKVLDKRGDVGCGCGDDGGIHRWFLLLAVALGLCL